MMGCVVVENGIIKEVVPQGGRTPARADVIIDGKGLTLLPAFIDLHAHFRDPGFPEKETLESASLAARAGGYAAVVCMANTKPALDTFEAARSLRERSAALGLIDLYPAMALTKGMEGKELSDIKRGLMEEKSGAIHPPVRDPPLMFSEDGKDVFDDALFLDAFAAAARFGAPVSCHCDNGGVEAETAKHAGEPREVWSRIEENNATERALRLGREAGCAIHIAHVSTKESVALLRDAKRKNPRVTCEATPHHIALTGETAALLGKESFGRVNPPLRDEEDRLAVIAGIVDGAIDAIATDHAPHTARDKANGAPGFSGIETAFAVCYTELARKGLVSLQKLSSLMSAAPARILGLKDRGALREGLRADLVIVDTKAEWIVEPSAFKSRGKNSAFTGRKVFGKTLATLPAPEMRQSAYVRRI
ncbi:MAG: dihydroorotase [Treponema sp.]|jgi:dihydroorotase|nr:dihydroorotase [Treponema sp.]